MKRPYYKGRIETKDSFISNWELFSAKTGIKPEFMDIEESDCGEDEETGKLVTWTDAFVVCLNWEEFPEIDSAEAAVSDAVKNYNFTSAEIADVVKLVDGGMTAEDAARQVRWPGNTLIADIGGGEYSKCD